MKHSKTRFLALCGLVVLTAAVIAPVVATATCPDVIIECPGGRLKSCPGTEDGDGHCVYSYACLHC
jgi:hypothetical protein